METEKKVYVVPSLEILWVDSSDVICTSGHYNDEDDLGLDVNG